MSPWQKKSIGVAILNFLKNFMVYKLHPSHMSQWRYQLVFKIAYLRYKFQLNTVSRSWDTKGGCSLSSTHTILEERRAIVWLAHYCVHIILILCVAGVYNPLFSQLRYSPETYLWWCAQKLKVASRINEKFSGKFQGHRMSLTWDIKKWFQNTNPMTIYPFNVNNKSTRRRCEVYSELIKLTLLLTLNIFYTFF